MHLKRTLIITACLLLGLLPVSAQPKNAPAPDKKENFEQIQSAKVAFFTTQLELSTEEAEKFWPVYNKYWEARNKEHKAGKAIFKRIREAASGNMSDVEMKSLLLEWQNHEKRQNDIEALYLDEFYKILPVKKVLKIYVAEEDFRIKMIKMWKKPHDKPNPAPNHD